ncbi:hypothetical protein [Imhoffiella purpurea]|uniref:HEPN domain-containing protein n=1 Tax=Imhoffiella purpurea TaxID=1249627 RepID=W9V156_9GAMM|nr:hypothetical protein [Imhoffiella purpurea]EXJ13213.1 hypothetical protein D779_3960 [Imhoffiella purpurea]
MAYDVHLEQSATRHYQDGKLLMDNRRLDAAGYHFGFAAECAIKHLMREAGVMTDDPAIWAHFPGLRVLALQSISGRMAGPLRTLLERENFMQLWDVRMRYAPNGSIEADKVERWRGDADAAIGCLYRL